MDRNQNLVISELAREAVWAKIAPVLVETLTPGVIRPDDVSVAGALDLRVADTLKEQFYLQLEEASNAYDHPTESLAVLWGGEAVQFARIKRLITLMGGNVAIGVVGEGVIQCRAERLAPRLRWLFDHFCQLDVFGLDVPGGISVFADRRLSGWIELTIVGKPWVSALETLATW